MADYWLIYQEANNPPFQLTQPPNKLVKSTVIPGLDGEQDLYIDKHHRRVGDNTVHLITYTHHALSRSEIATLINRAGRFAKNHPLENTLKE